MQSNSFKIQYLPTGTFSFLGEDSAFLKTDGVGPCVVLHFHNKEKSIVGMAHVPYNTAIFAHISNNKFQINERNIRDYINLLIKKIQEKSNIKIADFDITLINNKIFHHRDNKKYNEFTAEVGQDMIDTVDICLKEKGCNVIHRNVNFEDHDKRYISVVTNGGGGIEVYPVAQMNMELLHSLKAKNAEEFKQMQQPKHRMRYEDLVQYDNSQYANMLANFQNDFEKTEKLGANFAPPQICSRVKKDKDGQNMNIDNYPLKFYRGMNVMR